MQCDEIVLPVSGLRVEWRPTDQHFRIRPAGAADSGAAAPPWRTWQGHNDMAVGASGPIPQEPQAMWWAIWGEYSGNDVQVTLDDQSRPGVVVFNRLWICEWRGPEREATVVTAGRQAEIQFAPPVYAAPHARHNRPGGGSSHIETPAGFHEIPRRR
ncbi:hypothetical protein [Nocardia sp. NBC_01327]|uniref:hypothetical protein n=1 Tax=Nocardia sp. NBC_01327 TaxID=2903593 RepID=UPI002E0D9C25|nr:hypothetical protein OG326_18375 [Nocardia sp. NBC_01327]